MNAKRFSVSLALAVVLALTAGLGLAAGAGLPAPDAGPLGTDFTYQGRLTDTSGGPIGGPCDFSFSLWDALTGGLQVGTTLYAPGVSLRDGLFTVSLDFGAVFDGTALWLEVAVQCGADPGYTTLAPRQALTGTPHALYAVTSPWAGLTGVPAGFADNVDNDTLYSAGVGLLLAGTEFSADAAYLQRRVADACPAGRAISAIGGDGTVTCVETGTGDITAVSAGEGLTGGGASGAVTLTVAFGGSGAATTVARSDHNHNGVYSLVGHTHPGTDITSPVAQATYAVTAGDADTVDGSHASAFAPATHSHYALDASDGSPTQALYVDAEGRVGIGVTTPGNALQVQNVAGDQSPTIFVNQTDSIRNFTGTTPDNPNFATWLYDSPVSRYGMGQADGLGLVAYENDTGDPHYGNILFYTGGDGVASAERMRIDYDGDVGIGTNAPAYRLDVVGAIRLTGQLISTAGGVPPLVVASNALVNNLNADLLDGQHSTFYQDATNINAGTLSPSWYSAYSDLTAEGYLNNAPGDLALNNSALQSTLNADMLDGNHSNAFATAGHSHDHGALTGLADDDHPQYFNLSQPETVNGNTSFAGISTFNGGATFNSIPALNGGTTGSTAPFTVDSTFLVTNLNADQLDGIHASNFSLSGHNHWGETWNGTGTGLTLSGGTTGLSGSGATYGVYGTSSANYGVYGGGGAYGVYGTGSSYGVFGSSSNYGVYGTATASSGATYGVWGQNASTSGRGVYGQASASSGTTYGVYGGSQSTAGYGGYFISSSETEGTTKAGVYGVDYSDTGFGVAGHNYWAGVGVGAWSYSGRLIEARSGDYPLGTLQFYVEADGDVFANGTYNSFKATGDGGHRTLYGMSSAEAWAEDFGSAALKDGRATVTIDPIFAQTVNLAVEYHVYLTPICSDLILIGVTQKGATSFTVQGATLDGKPSSCSFDYRIVAKQRGYEDQRLEEVDIPAPVVVEKEKEP